MNDEDFRKMWEEKQKLTVGKIIVAIIEYGFLLFVLFAILASMGLFGRY